MRDPIAAYVGAADDRIHVYALDPQGLTMRVTSSVETGTNPSFLAFDPQRRWLVAVNEGADTIESFTIAPDGALARVNAQPAMGNGPAHIAVDATGRWVLVANYGDGSIAVFPIGADGTLGAATDTAIAGANAHQIVLDATNTVAYVPCAGADHVAVYTFDASAGTLTARRLVQTAAGSGPRHIAFHPAATHAFVIHETSSTLTSYRAETSGELRPLETVSTLPDGFTGQNTGAEIAVHRSGAYVYASNRGHDSIVRLAFAPGTGLTDPRHVSTFGPRPRHFSLVLDDTVMLVANQAAGSIHAFRVGAGDGALTHSGEIATSVGPQFVGAFTLP